MKVVLALAPFEQVGSYGGAGLKQRGFLPPLGVGHIASYLAERGHQVAFFDCPAMSCDPASAAELILAENPDVVGISCLTRMVKGGYALANLLKTQAPEIPVVMGGAHVTSFWQDILRDCPGVDILVPGEGEITMGELLGAMQSGENWREVAGIVYRGPDNETVATPPRPLERDLDQFPHPLRSIYRHDLYIPLPNQSRRRPATTVITSRGCPYGKCAFCYQGGKYASAYRRRSPENVIAEIRDLKRDYGIREIIFWDDNFGINSKWVDRFCDLLDQEKMDITWTIQARANTVSEAMLKRMAASGCYSVYYGFESGNQTMLDRVKKGITLDQTRAAVRWAKNAGMEIRGSFILGMPADTPEIAEETIRFAMELNVDWMIFYPYHLQAGTPLAELAARDGAILEELDNLYMPSYVPAAYKDAEQIAALIRSAYRRYYLRPAYILRALWRARKPVVLRNYLEAFRYWLSLL